MQLSFVIACSLHEAQRNVADAYSLPVQSAGIQAPSAASLMIGDTSSLGVASIQQQSLSPAAQADELDLNAIDSWIDWLQAQ